MWIYCDILIPARAGNMIFAFVLQIISTYNIDAFIYLFLR
jgi:hypothetical protein